MLSLLILLTLLPVCRPQQGSTQFVRICGQYPNRYLSYGPCPDENGQPQQQQICSRAGWSPTGISCRLDTDCTGGQRLQQTQRATNLDVSLSQCDQGQCCAPPMSPNGQPPGGDGTDGYLWWDTCENGGYFTGQNCQTSRDCVATGQWAHYSQICLQGECCTTGGASQPGNGGDGNQNLDDICLRNGGRRLRNSGCIRHADCNILVGRLQELPRIEASQQILCQNSQCCLMRRTLPIGFTSWAQACPQSGGRFLGMFCKMDQQDCRTTADSLSLIPQRATCELRRYCCASSDPSNDRWRRQNLGCDQGDRPTGSRCRASGDCYQGEYCGDQSICCLLRGNDARPDPGRDDDTGYPGDGRTSVPAFCYNGQQSMVNCSRPEDCKLLTQACVNGLCCTRTGDEWKNACAGAMAVSSCFLDRSCLDRLVCTSSDFCCECAFGQAAGKCTHGCPPNYACAPNGEFCCPRCAGGEQPHGSCYNGQCGTGYTCSAGNICCRS